MTADSLISKMFANVHKQYIDNINSETVASECLLIHSFCNQ